MIGVDIGGSHIKVVRLEEGAITTKRRIERPEDNWLDETANLVNSLEPAGAIGIGVAGLVDHPAGRLIWAPHISAVDVEVASEMSRRLGRTVLVDNDANCAALAESRLGPGAGVGSVLVVMIGTGIGMGLVLEGQVYRGRSVAGEAGHMTMDPGGIECACGRRGCWETLVSGWRLLQQWDGDRSPATVSAIAAAARSGDRRAHALLAEAGHWLGRGLANLIAVLDPNLIVVGGGVIEGAGEEILAPARAEIGYVLEGSDHRETTPVLPGRFGMWAGAVGAALLPTATDAGDLS
ncbi:MAG TPA: ROK family protein [Acidimicrobiia bacterium]|nr:ROK family protein [Acidimicrobiia bacterium]